jgi:hypothetical protein
LISFKKMWAKADGDMGLGASDRSARRLCRPIERSAQTRGWRRDTRGKRSVPVRHTKAAVRPGARAGRGPGRSRNEARVARGTESFNPSHL